MNELFSFSELLDFKRIFFTQQAGRGKLGNQTFIAGCLEKMEGETYAQTFDCYRI